MTNYISLGENRSVLALSFSLRHRTTPEGVVILQISMKSSTRSHRTICLIKNQVFREYKRLFLSSVPCVWILIACVCVCVCVCVYTYDVTICRRRREHVSTAFQTLDRQWYILWNIGRIIHRSIVYCLPSLLSHLFFFPLFSSVSY